MIKLYRFINVNFRQDLLFHVCRDNYFMANYYVQDNYWKCRFCNIKIPVFLTMGTAFIPQVEVYNYRNSQAYYFKLWLEYEPIQQEQ